MRPALIGPRYVGPVELPWPVGTHDGPGVRPRDVDPLAGKARWTPSGMAGDYRFFSHAVLVVGGLPVDPVALYWAENGLDRRDVPLLIDLGRPCLKGPAPPMDRQIYACPNRHAEGLFAFLDRLGCRRPGGEVWEAVRQSLPVVDWILAGQLSVAPPRPPELTCELYGWSTPSGAYGWRPALNPWKDLPCLTFSPSPAATTPSSSPGGSPPR